MYKNTQDSSELSAFRAAEKRYQRHVEQVIKFRKGKPRGARQFELPPNLSGVVDVDALPPELSHTDANAVVHQVPSAILHNLRLNSSIFCQSARAFTFPAHPGFVLFRGALAPVIQDRLAADCLTQFPNHPGHTNFNRTYGYTLDRLWEAAHGNLRLCPRSQQQNGGGCEWAIEGTGPPARQLLRKLRWASIGPVFDWTRRIYMRDVEHLPLPGYLVDCAEALASTAAVTNRCIDQLEAPEVDGIVAEAEVGYRPDAALINYYHPGDTLCGHIDDAEVDLCQPLVSISLGCPAIFLIGGGSKDVVPTAVLLRSGDAVVLGGHARRSYHGVPRILPYMEREESLGGTEHEKKESLGGTEHEKKESLGGTEHEKKSLDALGSNGIGQESLKLFAEYMTMCRINVSVRSTA